MLRAMCTAVLFTGAVLFGEPTGGDKDGKSDKDLLQGPWRVVSAEVSGKKASADELKELQKDPMVFRGDRLIGRYEADYKLDPTKSPKEIDVTPATTPGTQKMTFRGIYRLDGDELTLCLGSVPNGDRPTGFTLKDGAKAGVIVLKRMK
jgi:uncharacterized protein (TIGR03067 family)